MPPASAFLAGATSKKKKKLESLTPEQHFQRSLASFSRSNDLTGALELYRNSPPPRGLSANHFNTLLHLCASAPDPSVVAPTASAILQHMLASGIHPSEASLSSAARVAAAGDGGGDKAFSLVKEMTERYGLGLKLRTCAPALIAYCKNAGNADKAYEVEKYMGHNSVALEEPEIRALLRVSIEAGREEKVYEYLHKLRDRRGPVESETGKVIEQWFGTDVAHESGVGEWDAVKVREQVVSNGGGWHGSGWLGKGSWNVKHARIVTDGQCSGCTEVLKGVDIGCMEVQNFAEAIASLANKRETFRGFREFQEWLDDNHDYGAVVDGANVGLYQQNFADGGFCLSQVESAVNYAHDNGKCPLVILHCKRLESLKTDPSVKELLDDWLAQGMLYATPKGSNDDWYWLYAAVKMNCWLITNDEMRDHIFEFLGSKFVPAWKERHQVRYTFLKGKFKSEMPLAYSVVIQESESGSWHIPLKESCEGEQSRTWLCITRRPLDSASTKATQSTNSCNSITGFGYTTLEHGNSLQTMLPSHEVTPTLSILGKRKPTSSSP